MDLALLRLRQDKSSIRQRIRLGFSLLVRCHPAHVHFSLVATEQISAATQHGSLTK